MALNERKSGEPYLEAINLHKEEKSQSVYDNLEHLAETRDEIRLLEIGPGGGVMLDGLARRLEQKQLSADMSVFAIDLHNPIDCSPDFSAAADRLNRLGVDVQIAQADALGLPFRDESIDLINVSAVGHEIYSYGGGYEGLTESFSEASRVLSKGGRMVYRDVYPVESDFFEPHKAIMIRPGMIEFTKKFLPYYLEHAKHPYDEMADTIDIKDYKDSGLVTHMPLGLTRDLQRHYLMFRDSVWRRNILGFKPNMEHHETETEWLEDSSIPFDKKVWFEVSSHAPAWEYPVLKDGLRNGGEVWMSGRQFDAITDLEINAHFTGIRNSGLNWDFVVDEWLEREGPEVYVYADVGSMKNLSMLTRAVDLETVGSHYVPRHYYTGYLHDALYSGALRDGKIEIVYEKPEAGQMAFSLENDEEL